MRHERAGRFERSGRVAGALLLAMVGACGGNTDKFGDQFGVSSEALQADNGLSVNGLSVNGLSVNGLSVNGLSVNGLSVNGFKYWFGQNPAQSDEVMRYVVRCALPAGKTLSYTYQWKTYTWSGALGLTPGWAGGAPATPVERQLISACLAAHANKYGRSVSIAVEGEDANGVQIPVAAGELTTYSFREGAFFGDLTGFFPVVYACADHPGQGTSKSSVRTCAFDPADTGVFSDCWPIQLVGSCNAYCTPDATKTYYESCSFGGATYKPVTTRMLPSDIYTCGDGVCQVSESSGFGMSSKSCRDCPWW